MVGARIKISANLPVFHVGHIAVQLEKVMIRVQHDAIAEWARTIISKIPTYTGTAKGTYASIGKTIKNFNLGNPGGISAQARWKISQGTTINGRHYSLGFQAGKQYADHKLFNIVNKVNITCVFQFTQNLPYAVWNDFYPAPAWLHLPSSPPWHAMEKGKVAFVNYVVRELPKAIKRDVKFVKLIRIGN